MTAPWLLVVLLLLGLLSPCSKGQSPYSPAGGVEPQRLYPTSPAMEHYYDMGIAWCPCPKGNTPQPADPAAYPAASSTATGTPPTDPTPAYDDYDQYADGYQPPSTPSTTVVVPAPAPAQPQYVAQASQPQAQYVIPPQPQSQYVAPAPQPQVQYVIPPQPQAQYVVPSQPQQQYVVAPAPTPVYVAPAAAAPVLVAPTSAPASQPKPHYQPRQNGYQPKRLRRAVARYHRMQQPYDDYYDY